MKVCDMCLMRAKVQPTNISIELDSSQFHLCREHQEEVIQFINAVPPEPEPAPKRRGRPPKNSQGTADKLQ